MPPDKNTVIIIGGGVAGLTAALHLAQRGFTPLILESAERPGGRLAGAGHIVIDNHRFPLEHGVHGIWSSYTNLRAMLAAHNMLKALIPAQDEQWIHRLDGRIRRVSIGSAIRNSFIPAPFHYINLFLLPKFWGLISIFDMLSIFNVWSVLSMAIGIDPFAEDQPMQGLTFGAALKKWGPSFRALFHGLTRNGLATNPDEVPLAGFLAFLRFYTVMRRDAWHFDYLPDGGGELVEKLADRILQLGGRIQLNSAVKRVEKNNDWHVHYEQDGVANAASASFIILASDSPAAEAIISRSFPTESFFFPAGLGHAIARFWFDIKPNKAVEAGMFSGEFVMHNFFWLDRIYETYRAWSVETGGSCIEVHVYGPDSVLKQPDAALLANIITDLYSAHPELKGHIIGKSLQRNAAAHTLPALGARGTHLGIETPWPNFFCAGDWVRHEAPAFFLERACVTGLIAANHVLRLCGAEEFEVKPYPPPEPLAAWIESLMLRGRGNRKRRRAL